MPKISKHDIPMAKEIKITFLIGDAVIIKESNAMQIYIAASCLVYIAATAQIEAIITFVIDFL